MCEALCVCAEGITAVQGGVLPTTVSRNGGQWVYCVTTDPIPLSHIVLKLQTDYWTANKHPCVAWELPWTRDLTCSRSLSSRVPGPLQPLIVDCFWWASTLAGTCLILDTVKAGLTLPELTHLMLLLWFVFNITLFHVLQIISFPRSRPSFLSQLTEICRSRTHECVL